MSGLREEDANLAVANVELFTNVEHFEQEVPRLAANEVHFAPKPTKPCFKREHSITATLLASSMWSTALIQVMRGLPNNIVIHHVCCVAKLARKVRLTTDMVLGECVSQDQQSDLSKGMQD